MKTQHALLECLPLLAYDRTAPNVVVEATAAAKVIDGAIDQDTVLQNEQQPGTTLLMLADWERNYGLPDACIGGYGASDAARRKNLIDRYAARGNLSRQFYIDKAAALGYPGCTITEMGPMTCEDPCDSYVNGFEVVFWWQLNVPFSTVVVDATCEAPCDALLQTWGNTQLECVFNRLKPAHTMVTFHYAS